MNADPNYGAQWYFCSDHPLDSPLQILHKTKAHVANEIRSFSQLYQRAIIGEKGFREKLSDEVRERWQREHISSIHVLYPKLQSMTAREKYSTLFQSNPITL